MVATASGYFQASRVVGSFEVYNKEKGDTSSQTLKVRKSYHDGADNRRKEQRTHMRTVIATGGLELRNTEGPRALLEALSHAMIGYLNVFRKGWQPCAVSNGNIMLVAEFDVRNCPADDEVHAFGLEYCSGVLTDGDQAIKWKGEQERATRRSGTLPFISVALLVSWSLSEPSFHTALDDFESFVWVFVWELLHKGASLKRLSARDSFTLKRLKGHSPANLSETKGLFAFNCREKDRVTFKDSFLSPFLAVLSQWFTLVKQTNDEIFELKEQELGRSESDRAGLVQDLAQMEALCLEAGRKLIRIGLEHLPQLDESWPAPLDPHV
ncbi:hypothetical protein B0H16DRAFT_1308327 [Mycena metata]|uniref:Fungal-type protein kinase domain-containing protein n=1 Tax=Mycena metata TaxID=1033252 RepID=A0AAD7JSD9_9AGAR|nr:hypothetical protein B0H16DRAFT_1308327 [Mycena metata]